MWVQMDQFLTQAERLPPETKVPGERMTLVLLLHTSQSSRGFPNNMEDHISATEVGKEEIPEWFQLPGVRGSENLEEGSVAW